VIPHAGPAGNGTVLVASQFYLPVSAMVANTLWCEADTDCAATPFSRPVTTSSECYCVLFSAALNTSTAATYRSEWTRYCTARPMICPEIAVMRRTAVCVNHACALAPLSTP